MSQFRLTVFRKCTGVQITVSIENNLFTLKHRHNIPQSRNLAYFPRIFSSLLPNKSSLQDVCYSVLMEQIVYIKLDIKVVTLQLLNIPALVIKF